MEVIGGVSAILSIIDTVTRVAKRLNEVRESYNNVALNTALVEGQLSTIRAALIALYEWRASDRDSSQHSKQLDKDLGMSLSCCAILIGVIDGKLDEAGHKPGLVQKIKYSWLENILKEYISNLEGQVRALQLLLTIFQCRTEAEKRQRLGNEESRTIMEQVRAETASLAFDNKDFQETASILSLPSVTFDIDSILLQSPAYRRVYGDARRCRPPVTSADPIENSEQAARPTSTPCPNEMHQPPLPSRPTHNPLPQSRGRMNVWSFYPSKEKEKGIGERSIMAESNGVFELSDDTQMSSIASRQNNKSREVHGSVLQREETASKRGVRHEEVIDVDSSTERTPEEKPLSMQTEKLVTTAPPAAADEFEPVSSLKGFMDQLNLAFAEKNPSQDDERDLGLLYGTAAALEAEKSRTVAVQEDQASQFIARMDSKVLGHQLLPRSEDLGPTVSCENSSQEQFQRPMSTHSSLYKCSILPDQLDESTGTSSPYSCDSCKNLDATDFISDDGLTKPEPLDPDHPSLQSESESAKVQRATTDSILFTKDLLDERHQKSVTAVAVTSSESQLKPPKDVLPLFTHDANVEQHTRNEDHTTYPNVSIDTLAQSENEGLDRFEMSQSMAGLGIQRVESPEPNGTQSQTTKEPSSSLCPPGHLTSRQFSTSMPLAETGVADSGKSTTSSDRPSSGHDATSTISSSEPPESSTILSLQQSNANTIATSITSHAPGLHPNQTLQDQRRLQKEHTEAKAKGDSRAAKEVLQQSIEAISRKRPADSPADASTPSKQSPSPRAGKARSGIMRFPSLLGSTKGVMLGALAASGDTSSVEDLLKEKVDVDSRSDNFKTPLIRAAINGHIECLNLLKQFGADEVAVDASRGTVLHIAVINNQLAVVRWLLKNYPPPNTDLLRHRPSIFFRATDVVKGVRAQKNLRETSDARGSKPLHIAAELDKGGMVETLLAAGVDIESKDNSGRTPFHRAIISKRRDSFDTLLRNGAQISAVDAKSVSSLHLAAEAGQVDMMETLLAKGAKPWEFDAEGRQPIHSAVCGGNVFAIEALVTQKTDLDRRTKSGQTLLHLACLKTDVGVATYLLTKLVDVNPWAAPTSGVLQALTKSRVKGSSLTPLHYACCMRDFEMAVLLLDHDALVNAPTPEGATALMMAVEAEDTNIVNLLLQRGAKVNAKIPGSLITALHLAARRGDLETVQQLCRKGADFNTRTNISHSKSPLEETLKCPNKKKGLAVEEYLRTIITNNRNKIRANARNLEATRTESSPPYYTPSAGQIAPLADAVSYAPWSGTQQAQAQTSQYYHPDFDVPDEILPAYEPGPSVPAHLANQAPVYRGQDA